MKRACWLLIAFLCIAPPLASKAESTILEAQVVNTSATHPVVIINRGVEHGLREGDRVVLHDDRRLIAAGEIVHVAAAKAGVSVRRMPEGLPDPCDATIIRGELAPPMHTYRVARVDSVLPGDGLLWIDSGSRDGWRVGNAVLVHSGRESFGFGTVVEVGERAALVDIGSKAESGSGLASGLWVEQIGPVGGVIRSRINRVLEGEDAKLVQLVGTGALGIRNDDRFDFFRGASYAGFGRMMPDGPSTAAEWVAAFAPQGPQPGDEAISRTHESGCAAGYVFRIEGDYCLISIGQNDGIEAGETLASDSGNLQVRVQTLYPDHCGASLASASPGAPLRMWMRMSRQNTECGPGGVVMVKSQPTRHAPWLVEIAGESTAGVGDWVCDAADGALAIVANVIGDRKYAVRADQYRLLPTAVQDRND